MTELRKEDLYNIEGGAARWGIYAALGALATFVAGFVDGYVHLKRCN